MGDAGSQFAAFASALDRFEALVRDANTLL